MNPIKTLNYLIKKASSIRGLAKDTGIPYSTLKGYEARTAKSVNLETVDKLDVYLNKQTQTDNIEPFLPTNLRAEFDFIAMHGLSELNYQWAAFTIEPTFNPKTGFWSLPKYESESRPDTGKQVNLSNLLDLPYDSQGPAKALYKRNSVGFDRAQTVHAKVYHPVVSEQPLQHADAQFPRTTQKGLTPSYPSGERNRI